MCCFLLRLGSAHRADAGAGAAVDAGAVSYTHLLAEIGLSKDVVVVTITRGEEMLIPRGETTLESGDKVMVIAKNHSLHDINELFGR